MNRRAGRWLALVLCLLGPGWARAWQQSTVGSVKLSWPKRQITYLVNDFAAPSPAMSAPDVCGTPASDPAAASAAVQKSFDTWMHATHPGEAAPCTNLKLVFGGTTPDIAVGGDNQNVVVWRSGQCNKVLPPGDPCWSNSGDCASKYNCWEGSDASVLALTTVSYGKSSGQIFDADIELNGWDGQSPTAPPGFYYTCLDPPAALCTLLGGPGCIEWDVQNTVTHEAGHVLGLAHNCDSTTPTCPDPNATMYPKARMGETSKRDLQPDDIDGICTLYPPDKGCGCGSTGAEGLLGLLGLLLLRLRSRRSVSTRSPPRTQPPCARPHPRRPSCRTSPAPPRAPPAPAPPPASPWPG